MSHLVERLKKTAIQLIKERLDHLFEVADSWLMDQIDSARDPRLQQQYTEMMRFLKLYRHQFEEEYYRCIGNAFSQLNTGASGKQQPQDSRPPLKDVSFDALTLVGHEEMEQNVALDSMVARCRSELDINLQMLQARIQSLMPGVRLTTDNNPLDPKVLCEALGRSVSDIPWDVKHDLIFFKLFQRYVLGDYGSIISGADSLLVDAGVLKNLNERELLQYHKQGMAQKAAPKPADPAKDPAKRETPQGDSQPATENPAGPAAGGNLPQQRDWSQVLQGAMASLQRPSAFAGQSVLGSQSPQAAQLPLPDLVQMFQQLQSAQNNMAPGSYWQTSELCSQLNQLIQQKGGNGKEFKVGEVDTNIINLVSRLFEQVLEQDQLPGRIKALLSRLQIPYIRVAVTDPEFLGSTTHPARRLINEMANAGLELDENTEGQSDAVFSKIESVVETILSDYQDDVSLLKKLDEDFDTFMERESQRSRMVAQRMAALEEGKARSAQARSDVAEAMQERLQDQQIPESMAQILDNIWYNYLCWIHHREGKDSFAWNKALFLIDQMLACLLPVDSEEEAEDRLASVEELESAVRLGSERINYHDVALDRWLAELGAILREKASYTPPETTEDLTSVAQPEPEDSVEPVSEPMPGPTPSEASDQNNAPQEEATPQSTLQSTPQPEPEDTTPLTDRADRFRAPRIPVKAATETTGKVTRLDVTRKAPPKSEPAVTLEPLPEDDPGLLQAQKLAVGALMDYQHQGNSVRCKLAARIKSVDKLIFVNRSGAKLFEKSLLEVAYDINEGKLNLLEDAQLFDRALESVISSLRNVRDQAV